MKWARATKLHRNSGGVVIITVALLVAHAQSTCQETALPTIRATSTLVAVPTLVFREMWDSVDVDR